MAGGWRGALVSGQTRCFQFRALPGDPQLRAVLDGRQLALKTGHFGWGQHDLQVDQSRLGNPLAIST